MKGRERKLQNLVRRGIVSNATTDTLQFPRTQIRTQSGIRPAEEIYSYGQFGVAPAGALALVFQISGNEDNLAALTYSPKLRPEKLKAGEYACGNFLFKNLLKFANDGSITATATENGSILLQTTEGAKIEVTKSGIINLLGKVNLGEGAAQGIARLGDQVTVGGVTGTITSASTNHKAS